MDNNYIVNRILDILANENQNLLVGNITSPRINAVCQVSTSSGIKSAYNLNCTYPGNAIVVWDKYEKQYYCFTTKPSEVISSKQLSYRKNRDVIVKLEKTGLIKILYSSTIGNTVKIYVGGCYEVPKLLYSYSKTTTYPTITDLKIDSIGNKKDDWIVGGKELTGIIEYPYLTIDGTSISNYSEGRFLVYEGTSTYKYASSILSVDQTKNIGKGLFLGSGYYMLNVPTYEALSYNYPLTTFSNSLNESGYSATISHTIPNFYKGNVTYQTYSGVAQVDAEGNPVAGILGISGLLNGLPQGSGIMYLTNSISKTIRSATPNAFGTINGQLNNVDVYDTLLLGNDNQYMYVYTYVKGSQSGLILSKYYLESKDYGLIELFTIPFTNKNYINWINNLFIACLDNTGIYLGTGLKETDVYVSELQANGSFLSLDPIKANFYAIPKASNETIEVLSASYYLNK